MLQIITGKFFRDVELYTTRQRGVLYSNYHMLPHSSIETVAGRILPVESWHGVKSILYEVDQRLEAVNHEGEAELVVAVTGDYLIQDFAAVTSFVLNITCTPNFELAQRLTQSRHQPLGVSQLPKRYIRRVFDEKIEYAPGDDANLTGFMRDLTGLKREEYETVIRAIRRYVVGLHRVGDDLELAYTMFVASIESLAQEFDKFVPTWGDYRQDRRQQIDKALKDVDDGAADAVRAAILQGEHLALTRRFREFAMSHVTHSYFREEAILETKPARRSELAEALDKAYDFRSKAVHTLRELPRPLTAVPSHREIETIEGQTVLSLQGMARLARHIIFEFVRRGQKVEKEEFNYRLALPNIVLVPMAERYWIWNREGYNPATARRYLSGFLSEYTSAIMAEPGAGVTDLTSIMEEIEAKIKGLAKPGQRLPLLALYMLFNGVLPPNERRPKFKSVVDEHFEIFAANSPESLLMHLLGYFKGQFIWSTADFVEGWTAYKQQKKRKDGLDFGPTLDTAFLLLWADKYRQEGDIARARELITEAVEEMPGHPKLIRFETAARAAQETEFPEIDWRGILLPSEADAESNEVDKDVDESIFEKRLASGRVIFTPNDLPRHVYLAIDPR